MVSANGKVQRHLQGTRLLTTSLQNETSLNNGSSSLTCRQESAGLHSWLRVRGGRHQQWAPWPCDGLRRESVCPAVHAGVETEDVQTASAPCTRSHVRNVSKAGENISPPVISSRLVQARPGMSSSWNFSNVSWFSRKFPFHFNVLFCVFVI